MLSNWQVEYNADRVKTNTGDLFLCRNMTLIDLFSAGHYSVTLNIPQILEKHQQDLYLSRQPDLADVFEEVEFLTAA